MTDENEWNREINRKSRLGYDPEMEKPSKTRSKSRGAHGDRLEGTDMLDHENLRVALHEAVEHAHKQMGNYPPWIDKARDALGGYTAWKEIPALGIPDFKDESMVLIRQHRSGERMRISLAYRNVRGGWTGTELSVSECHEYCFIPR